MTARIDPDAHAASLREPPETPGNGLRHAWYAVALLTVANVSGLLDRQVLSLLVKPMKQDLGITDTQASLLAGLGFVVFYSALGLPIGRWVDRGSRRTIVGIGVAVWSLFTIFTGASRTFAQLLAARVGIGAGEATLSPAAVSIIGDAFPSRTRGFAMSVFSTAIFFGSGLGYFLAAQVVGAVDASGVASSSAMVTLPLIGEIHRWQTVFIYIGLPGFVIALLALFMREPPRSEPAGANVPLREVFGYFRSHARTVSSVSLGFAASSAVNWGVAFWTATFFERTHGWTTTQAGTYMGVLTMTIGVGGALLGGKLSDHWMRKGLVDAPLRVGIVAALGMIVTAGVFTLVSSATVAAAILAVVNVFAAMPWGAASAAIADALPSRIRGQGSAVYQLLVNLLGGALGPTAVALLTDKVFADPLALRWSLSICSIAGMVLTIALLQWGRRAYVRTVSVAGGMR